MNFRRVGEYRHNLAKLSIYDTKKCTTAQFNKHKQMRRSRENLSSRKRTWQLLVWMVILAHNSEFLVATYLAFPKPVANVSAPENAVKNDCRVNAQHFWNAFHCQKRLYFVVARLQGALGFISHLGMHLKANFWEYKERYYNFKKSRTRNFF